MFNYNWQNQQQFAYMELVSPRDISNESVKNNNKNPKTTKQKKKIYHGPGLLKTEMDTNSFWIQWHQLLNITYNSSCP